MDKKEKKSGFFKKGLDTAGKRLLVLTIAILMTFQFCTPTFSGVSFADEETTAQESTEAVETVTEEAQAEVQEAETPVQEETAAPEVEDASETVEPAAPEQPVAPVQKEAAAPQKTPAETPAADPALSTGPMSFKFKTPGGVRVNVSAEAGTFPAGTQMKVTEVPSEDVQGAVDSAMGGNATVLKAVDITFYNDKETDIQPAIPVKVKVTSDEFSAASDMAVVHVTDAEANDAEVVALDENRTTDTTAAFNADGFSVYAIVGTNDEINTETARRTYKFQLDDGTAYYFNNEANEKVDYQIVKNGDTLVAPDPDPTKEVTDDNGGAWKFDGWYNGNTKVTFGTAESGITADETVTLVAKFNRVYYVQYYDVEYQLKDGRTVQNIMESKEVASGATATVDSLEAVPLSANKKFSGWATTKDAETAQYHAGDTIANINSDIDLYPVLADAVWVRFDGKGGSYTGSLQIYKGEKATKPADPTREGFKFAGWCTDEACENAYDWNTELNADQLLYAKWESADVTYTIAYWQENADDDGYTFYEQEKKTGKTGAQTAATAPEDRYPGFHPYGNSSGETSDDYKLTQETITGDGKTVVNVYYNRNDYTVEFHQPRSSRVISELTITAKYGQTITDLWPSRRTGLSRTYPVNWVVEYGWSSNTYQSNLPQMPLNGAVFYLHEEDTGYVMTTNYYVQTAAGGDNFVLDHADVFNDDSNSWATTKEDYYEIKGYKPVFKRTRDAGDIESGKYVVDSSLSHTSHPVGDGYISDGNRRYHVNFYYVRDSFNVIFEPNASGAPDAKNATVMFGASLSGIAPTNYVVDKTTFTTDGKPYIFKGWYDNALGEGTAFDFNTTMPANSFTLYAKWEEQKFPINVDPNGGELGPKQATWFNVNAGEKIVEYKDISRDYIEDSSGTYYYHVDKRPNTSGSAEDPVRTSFYTTDASQSTDGGKKYKPEEDAYQLIGWFYADGDKAGQAFDFGPATGPANIIAHWKRVGKFTVTIFYKDADGKTETIPGLNYSDQANAVTPTSVPYTPDGQVLTGWEIKKDGQVIKSLGLGEEFKIDASTMSTRTIVDGYTEDIIEVDPVFEDSSTLNVTEIKFNANGGTGTIDPLEALDLNGNSSVEDNKVTLPSSGFTKEGYTLIGWSDRSGDNTVKYILGGNYAADGATNTLYAVWAEKIDVTVTGENVSEDYDGNEKTNAKETPKGYTVTASGKATTDASSLVDVTFADSVKAPARGTNAGEYKMGLSDETVTVAMKGQTQTIKNAGEVVVIDGKYYILGTKTVTDGKLTISPVTDKVTVTITENSDVVTYDGKEHTIKGYKTMVSDNTNYDVTTAVKATETAAWTVTKTDAGTYDMGIVAADFQNLDTTNFTNVEFKVVDGQLKINPITDKVTVTIVGNKDSKEYNGYAQKVEGYEVTDISNPLYKEADITFSGKAVAEGTNAGKYPMGLEGKFSNNSQNFTNVEFAVTDGELEITKIKLVLESAGAEKEYDGTPLTRNEQSDVKIVEGKLASTDEIKYDITGSQTYVGESDNLFTATITAKESAAGKVLNSIKNFFTAYADEVTGNFPQDNYDITYKYGKLKVTEPKDSDKVVTKTHEDKEYKVGDTVTFTIKVTNIYDEVQNITIEEQEGVKITGKAEFEDVEPGATVETTATYTVTKEDAEKGEFKNTATAKFENGKQHKGDDTVKNLVPEEEEPPENLVPEEEEPPKTGDATPIVEYTLILSAAVALLLMLLFRRRKSN